MPALGILDAGAVRTGIRLAAGDMTSMPSPREVVKRGSKAVEVAGFRFGLEITATARLRGGQGAGVLDEYCHALRLANEINVRFGEISIRTALAAAHRIGGDPANALEHAEVAICRIRRTGIRANLEGRALIEVGLARLDLGDPSCAATCLAAAVQVARRNGMRLIEARALDAYGRAVHANEGARAAAPHWRAALEIFDRIGAPEASQVRTRLGVDIHP
jgi:hypothetical protein